jgi:hypothetical protein
MSGWPNGDATSPFYVPIQNMPPPAAAERLFPHDDYLQREWMRAVDTVRKTRRGWLLDKPQARQQ